MVKKIVILLLSIAIAENSFAQNTFIDSLTRWIEEHPAIDSQHIATLHRISYRSSEIDVKKSYSYYEKVAALSDSLHFNYGKSLAQINLGILLSNSANFESSNTAYFKAIDYAELCDAVRLQAVSLNNIGDNFKVLKDYEKSRKYTKEAIVLNTRLSAWRGVAINYELLHECDMEEKKYSNAREMLVSGMPFAMKSQENYILAQFYTGFGKLKAIKKDFDSAHIIFR
ncbi:MAG: hypothetical protein WKI04_12215 [Ferruginibacter sp.]